MRSNYLSITAAALICSAALARSSPLVGPEGVRGAAEEMTYDAQGNMHWASERLDEARQVVEGLFAVDLGRPSFKLDMAAIEKQAEPSVNWFKAQLHEGVATFEDIATESLDKVTDGLKSFWEGAPENKAQLHEAYEQAEELASDSLKKVSEGLKHIVHGAEKQAGDWLSKGMVSVGGVQYERLVHPHFPEYALRVSEKPLEHCDPDVKSWAGYLDIGQDKHLWFAFFESRNSPATAENLLWLNGGPGCSSSTGWLMEGVGPCTIDKNGTTTKYNKHSWSENANVFFLDNPVNVGFSYSDGDKVNNTPQAAEDVYAFLQLFFAKFPKYTATFHIAAESYGGRYAPLFADKIWKENKKLSLSRYAKGANAPKHIPLASILLGNGLTEPQTQFASVPDFACRGPYAIFEPDSATCQTLDSKAETCAKMIGACYSSNSRLACLPANLYCWSSLYSDAQRSGLNLYDVRKKCDRSEDADGPLCYRDETYVQKYMNLPATKAAFSVPANVEFEACNMEVNQAFMMQGDAMHNSAAVLPAMIEDGLRVLVYAGEADFMCSSIGNEAWFLKLETSYKEELNAGNKTKWSVGTREAGYVRSAGKGAGNVAFVNIKDAGHMVPYDQPEAAQNLVKSWLANKRIA